MWRRKPSNNNSRTAPARPWQRPSRDSGNCSLKSFNSYLRTLSATSSVDTNRSPGWTTCQATKQVSTNFRAQKLYRVFFPTISASNDTSIRKKNGKNTSTWRLNNMLLKNQRRHQKVPRDKNTHNFPRCTGRSKHSSEEEVHSTTATSRNSLICQLGIRIRKSRINANSSEEGWLLSSQNSGLAETQACLQALRPEARALSLPRPGTGDGTKERHPHTQPAHKPVASGKRWLVRPRSANSCPKGLGSCSGAGPSRPATGLSRARGARPRPARLSVVLIQAVWASGWAAGKAGQCKEEMMSWRSGDTGEAAGRAHRPRGRGVPRLAP